MISPPSDSANDRLIALLPDAVGPRTARTLDTPGYLGELHEYVHGQGHEENDETELLTASRHACRV